MLQLLLGHLVGDYLLQTSWMAVNKSKKTLQGWMAAIVHSVIYTLSVCTYGKSLEDCESAAHGGNVIKRLVGFPEEMCNTQPRRLKKKNENPDSNIH